MMGKAAILILQLSGIVLLAGSVAAGAPDDSRPALQPQALNWAGVYALRQIDPNLTGTGVRFGVLCRSLTYVDGNPQNDYQPNMKHACFGNAQLQFHGGRSLGPRESPHSTAVCSILFGNDPAGTTPYLDPFQYQGVVPAAEGDVYELWYFLTQHVHPQNAPKVDVATVSFGTELEEWWTRGPPCGSCSRCSIPTLWALRGRCLYCFTLQTMSASWPSRSSRCRPRLSYVNTLVCWFASVCSTTSSKPSYT